MIIEIEGKQDYFCRVDSFGRIVFVDPPNDFLYMKMLRDVYWEFYDRAKFMVFHKDLKPDLVVSEDIFQRMASKNMDLLKLAKEFDLEII